MSGNHRPTLRSSTKEMIQQNAQRTQVNEHGQLVDPNNGHILDGTAQYGHVTGMENRGFVSYSDKAGMSQAELNDITNNPGLYQLESPEGNMGHESEEQDANETALNTANYCYLEAPEYQAVTYINPPEEEGGQWTLTVENTQTGVESQVGTFTPDLGEVTAESQAAVQSAVSSCSPGDTCSGNDMDDFGSGGISSGNDMDDFGSGDTSSDTDTEGDPDGNSGGEPGGDDDGNSM